MTTRIKILHIISNMMSGGAEAMLSKVALASAKHDIDHIVISMISGGRLAEELKSAGIPVHFLGAHRNFGAVFHIGTLRSMVRELQPDLIQGWMYHGNLAASVAAIFHNDWHIPVIWNVRQTVQTLRNESLLTALVILAGVPLSRAPRAIIYNSIRSANDHERLGYSRNRRVIIPNGFDTELFRPDASCRNALLNQLGLPSTAAIVGRVANFHPYKDFPTLFAAFDIISQSNPCAHLVLIGRDLDSKNQEFSRMMASLPSPDKVHIMEERPDVAHIMPGFDVLLSSSSGTEAFPNVIGEAMACGVPTVTTDAGDCKEILGDPTRVVSRRDARMLAEKTLEVLALNTAKRAKIGNRDRARVIEYYSIEAIAKDYAALWRRTISCD